MGCDWYCITTVTVSGLLFISKYIKRELRKQHGIIWIRMPIDFGKDGNCTGHDSDGNVAIFEDLSGEYREEVFNADGSVVTYNRNAAAVYDDKDMDGNVYGSSTHFYYVFPSSIISKSSISVPGQYDNTLNKTVIMKVRDAIMGRETEERELNRLSTVSNIGGRFIVKNISLLPNLTRYVITSSCDSIE